MPGPEVMLAIKNDETPEQTIARMVRDHWWFEVKYDGIRAVVQRTAAGAITITNRRQADITHRYPEIVEQLGEDLARSDFVGVLDGEIIVLAADGRPDFSLAHRRDAQSSPSAIRRLMVQYPASFVAFDILEVAGVSVRTMPYVERHALVKDVARATSVASQDGPTMWAFVLDHGLEGLIGKRGDAAYRPGRQRSWVKIKSTHRMSVIVCGVKPGNGSRGAIGALEMCLWNPSEREMVRIGSVGSGFSEAELIEMEVRLEGHDSVVVEVEYLEVSPAGQLRNPVFKGVRTDVAAEDCTLDTLGARRPLPSRKG